MRQENQGNCHKIVNKHGELVGQYFNTSPETLSAKNINNQTILSCQSRLLKIAISNNYAQISYSLQRVFAYTEFAYIQ